MAKTFDQFLAESGQQSKLDELRRTGRYSQAKAEYDAGGSSFSAPQIGGDFSSSIERAIELNRQAAQPAIQSLEASIPEVQRRFSSERTRLEEQKAPTAKRYEALLADVKSRGKSSEQRQTRITSGELGKRGIVGSSTLAQQEIQDAVEPISAGIRKAITDIGLSGEDAQRAIDSSISSLASQETEQTRAIRNAIAQMQSGATQSGISQGISLQETQAARRAAEEQAAREQALAERLYQTIQLPESQASIENIRSQIGNRGSESSGLTASDFLSIFSGGIAGMTGQAGVQSLSGAPSYGKNVIDLINQGKIDEAISLAYNP